MPTSSRPYLYEQAPPLTALPSHPPPPPPGPPPSNPLPPMPSASAVSTLGRSTSASSSSAGPRPSSRSAFAPHRAGSNSSGGAAVAESASPYLASSSGHPSSSLGRTGSQQQARSSQSHFSSGPALPSAAAAAASSSSSSSNAAQLRPTPTQQRMPSRTLLQQALSLAQQAVLLDQESQFADALAVYQTTVGLLEKVMERVEAGERRRRERGQSTTGGAGEEEGRTLRGIYDAYTSRIALLSEQLDQETPLSSPALSPLSITHPYQQPYSSPPAATAYESWSSANRSVGGPSSTPDQAAAYDGIGSAMLSTSNSSSTSLVSAGGGGGGGPSLTAPSAATTATVAVPYHRPRPPSQLSASSSHSRNQSLSGPSGVLDGSGGGGGGGDSPASHQRSLSYSATTSGSGLPGPLPSTFDGGAEADLRRQSLLDSLELSLGPPGAAAAAAAAGPSASGIARRPSTAGLLLEGVDEAPEGNEGTPSSSSGGFRPPSARSGQIVLETTSEGTISQRRKAGHSAGGGLPDLSISGGTSSAQSSFSLDLDPSSSLSSSARSTADPPQVTIASSSTAPSSASSSTTPSPTPLPPPLVVDTTNGGSSPVPVLKEKSSMFRLRALSQPGRRPTHGSGSEPGAVVPPVPAIQRKASFPAHPPSSGGISPGRSLGPFGIGRSASSSGAPSSGIGSGGGPGSLRSTSARSAASSREGFDHFHSAAAAAPVVVPPSPSISVHSAFNVLGSKTPVGRLAAVVGTSSHMALAPERPPADLALRPFHLMRLLRRTMTTPGGAYLSKRMHVAPETWTLMGVHLPAVDVKVEAIQQLADGLLALERAGSPFLTLPPTIGTAKLQEAGREWAKALDGFERLIDELQLTLGKKLNMEFGGSVKKSSGTSIMGLGNKLTRVMEKKFASGRNVNTVYVEDLNRLFAQAQFLDDHLRSLLPNANDRGLSSPSPSSADAAARHATADVPATAAAAAAYRALTLPAQTHIEHRLRRLAAFFGHVVVGFVLRDLGLLCDKYAKSVDKWLMD